MTVTPEINSRAVTPEATEPLRVATGPTAEALEAPDTANAVAVTQPLPSVLGGGSRCV